MSYYLVIISHEMTFKLKSIKFYPYKIWNTKQNEWIKISDSCTFESNPKMNSKIELLKTQIKPKNEKERRFDYIQLKEENGQIVDAKLTSSSNGQEPQPPEGVNTHI